MINHRWVAMISTVAVLLTTGCGGPVATSLATPAPPRPPVPSARPFMELLTGSAGIVDYQPSADPAEALGNAAYVFAGTVVALAEITEPTGRAERGGDWPERYVVLEVRVLDPIKGDPGDPAYIGIPAGSTIDQSKVRAAVPYGAEIAVRTMAALEGADPAARPIRPILVEGLYLQGPEDRTMIGGHLGEGSYPQWLKTCTVDAYTAAMKAAR
jgi:hypothetical protein